MKRLSRVLCAVDINDRHKRVFDHALALARRHDAKLLLLHAVSPERSFNHGATERVEFLRRLRSLAEAAGVDIRVTVQTGPVDEIILLHARARQADLIVIGTSKKETRRGLSGWIAERVLRDAPCPTLVVADGASAVTSPAADILCAVDFSPASEAAVQEAVRLADYDHRAVTLLHVVDGTATRELVGAALNRLRALMPAPDGRLVLAEVAVGRTVPEIIRTASALNAELLVIGASRRTRFGGRMFGETGQLLRDAPCPVLAVPVPTTAREQTESTHPMAA